MKNSMLSKLLVCAMLLNAAIVFMWYRQSTYRKLISEEIVDAKYVELSNYSNDGIDIVTDDPLIVEKVKNIELSELGHFEKNILADNGAPYPALNLFTAVDSPKYRRIGKVLRFNRNLVSSGKYGKNFQELIDAIVKKDDNWIIFMSMKPEGATEKEIQEYKKGRKRN